MMSSPAEIKNMKTYQICTDAVSQKIEASNADDAARKFAASERNLAKRGINGAEELTAVVEEMGGWCSVSEQ